MGGQILDFDVSERRDDVFLGEAEIRTKGRGGDCVGRGVGPLLQKRAESRVSVPGGLWRVKEHLCQFGFGVLLRSAHRSAHAGSFPGQGVSRALHTDPIDAVLTLLEVARHRAIVRHTTVQFRP